MTNVLSEEERVNPKDQWISWTRRTSRYTDVELKILSECEQDGQLWHDLRKDEVLGPRKRRGVIYASEAGTLIGVSKYTTQKIAVRKKFGYYRKEFADEKFTDNKFTRWGKLYEKLAAALMEMVMGETLYTIGTSANNEFPHLRASCDRINKKGDRIAELKCPAYKPHSEIPEDYYVQMRMQLACSGANVCFFGSLWINRPGKMSEFKVFEVEKDDNYWDDYFMPRMDEAIWFVETQNPDPVSMYQKQTYHHYIKPLKEHKTLFIPIQQLWTLCDSLNLKKPYFPGGGPGVMDEQSQVVS
jgi:putative phage-type endonuclease